MPSALQPTLRIAIIGGGPAGLGAAIALSELPHTEVTVYEQARELREIGAGIRIGFNCWRVLGLLGAAEGVMGHRKVEVLHRNGLTGEVGSIKQNIATSPEETRFLPQRLRRTNLQATLKAQVPDGVIQLNKKLELMEDRDKEVVLTFTDGTVATTDLVVGGDGIRSVVRQHVFPTHSIAFTGTTIWRVLIPVSVAKEIDAMLPATTWWHGPTGHVYVSQVDDPLVTRGEDEQRFEIVARSVVDPAMATGKRFSWGVDATNERVEAHFRDFDPRVRALLARVPTGVWKEFSAFAGPRLETLTAWEGKVVLVGDASHPISGAFGSGAALALEDGWVLARCLEDTRDRGEGLSCALERFDGIRSPYYLRMYEYLDDQKRNIQNARRENPKQSFRESLEARIAAFGGEDKLSWIYGNDIAAVWEMYLGGRREEERGEWGRMEVDR